MFDRAEIIDKAFTAKVQAGTLPAPLTNMTPAATGLDGSALSRLFEAQVMSRQLDLMARRSKGKTFYSLGSSGHEGMAALAHVSRLTDMAFLHYRDGAFVIARKGQVEGATPLWDMALSFTASAEDPVSGGRHKVLGGVEISTPPQTSTIASHLPKAVGAAHSVAINRRLSNPHAVLPRDAIILCTFGDASANHSTAQGAINAAAWTAYQNLPMPILFICEDNGIGISVRTPPGWIAASYRDRPGLKYFSGDARDICDAARVMGEAVEFVRQRRRPAFLHLRTVRLMGHGGADVEAAYSDVARIEADEAQDPLLHTARHLLDSGQMDAGAICRLYTETGERVARAVEAASTRPKLETAPEVKASVIPPRSNRKMLPPAREEERQALFAKELKAAAQPVPLARHLNLALADILLSQENAIVFGEDVARKGGVYSVTMGLQKKFGPARVIDTLLDEQSILGLAIGAAHNGLLPIPEIQFLAYLHNAEDQLRGEAATLPFFSRGQYANPMVLRIAGLGYQKGFGGHFHNDNSFNVLRDIPGLIVACPSDGATGAALLREAVRLAVEENRVVTFLEPIALYHTIDLHEKGDGKWAAPYDLALATPFGEIGMTGEGRDLLILTYGNGRYLSAQAEPALRAKGINCRIADLRWLHPLPVTAILREATQADHILIVDECRKTGTVSEEIITLLQEHGLAGRAARYTAEDSFIPLGPAATITMPSRDGIIEAAMKLVKGDRA